jgi:hypothetical protein
MSEEVDLHQELELFRNDYRKLRSALGDVLVGQDRGARSDARRAAGQRPRADRRSPGRGKDAAGPDPGGADRREYRRIQFTSDLMPADIIGTYVIMESAGRRRFEFQHGPIFTNLLLADEINRATPKTQAALFEALEERAVTVANESLSSARAVFRHRDAEPGGHRRHVPDPRDSVGPLLLPVDDGCTRRSGPADDPAAHRGPRTVADRSRDERQPAGRDGPVDPATARAGQRGAARRPHRDGDSAPTSGRTAQHSAIRAPRSQPARRPGDDPGRQSIGGRRGPGRGRSGGSAAQSPCPRCGTGSS